MATEIEIHARELEKLQRKINALIAEETGLPTRLADDPICAVATGTGLFLEKLDFFKRYLEADDETA